MVQINAKDDISGYIQTIYEQAMLVARDNNVMRGLVRGFSADNWNPRTNSNYGTATIHSLTDTDDLASQAFTPSPYKTLTPAEFGAQFLLTDARLEADPFTLRSDAALELGTAMGQQIDQRLLGNFSSLTAGTVGGGGSALTWPRFAAALSLLRNRNAPRPYYCVLHPFQWFPLGGTVIPGAAVANAPQFQDDAMRNFYAATVMGVEIYITSNITAGTAAFGAMFSRDAIAYDERRPVRIEPERDASRRAFELNLSTVYAHGVWRPEYGVAMVGDASTPNP